jgi:Flp pilus assembly pilin Flp
MTERMRGGLRGGPLFHSYGQVESTTNMMRDAVRFLLKRRGLDQESGQDLIEYALLVSLVVLVAIGAVTAVGTTIDSVFWTYISGVMANVTP